MERKTHLSLFTGIGGLDLAAEAAGFETVGQCEWADYPTKVLEKHWPDVPRWRDIRTLTGDSFYERTGLRTVDIISGGFPCQPFSIAGKQRGKEDDRYLWPEMARVIEELRPTWVVGENVAGIIKLALDDVLSDLEGKGYATRTFLIPAAGVGAPHKRYRTAIVGYSDSCRCEHRGNNWKKRQVQKDEKRNFKEDKPEWEGREHWAGKGGDDVSNTVRISRQWGVAFTQKTGERQPTDSSVSTGGDGSDTDNTAATRHRKHSREIHGFAEPERSDICYSPEWWAVEPGVGRVADGVPNRVDRLRCLGNAVVQQQFYPVFNAIREIELFLEIGI